MTPLQTLLNTLCGLLSLAGVLYSIIVVTTPSEALDGPVWLATVVYGMGCAASAIACLDRHCDVTPGTWWDS